MPWPFIFANTDLELGCTNAVFHTIPLDDEGGWVSPPRGPPLGNFIEGQAHPNVFAFLQFSSNRGLSIFCVAKFLSHVFFVFVFRWFRVFHRDGNVYFPIVFSSNSLYILYIFIFIFFFKYFFIVQWGI